MINGLGDELRTVLKIVKACEGFADLPVYARTRDDLIQKPFTTLHRVANRSQIGTRERLDLCC
jgi:hypothetical protein